LRETSGALKRDPVTILSVNEKLTGKIQRVVSDVLQPLLEADGGGLEVLSFDENKSPMELVVHLTGAFRGCPSGPIIQARVLEPAFKKALGSTVRVRLSAIPAKQS
jgi:Fe-S cluster biogenesis protein NfuA